MIRKWSHSFLRLARNDDARYIHRAGENHDLQVAYTLHADVTFEPYLGLIKLPWRNN